MPSSPTSLSPETAAAAAGGSPLYTIPGGRRASAAPASPRRYFVQPDEPRRASFTGSRFPTPSLPRMPDLPDLPSLPSLPNMPNMPNFPNFPNMPNLPNMPNMPNMSNLPHLPNMPNLELPRFSPYEMVQALSRSLSPMRYYMEGLDAGEQDRFGRPGSSPPGTRRSRGGRPLFGPELRPRSSAMEGVGEAGVWERYASAVLSSGEEDNDEDDEVDEESSSEEEGDESGSEEAEDEDDAVETEVADERDEDDKDDLALFGHP